MKFTDLNLDDTLLKAVKEQGYTTPTPIQQQAIPVVLEGRDILAAAQTGTGKTAGFTLPLLQKLTHSPRKTKKYQIRALVLTPTRELAAQVADSFETYGKHLSLRSRVIFGGVGINPQLADIRRGVDIIIATPGRLLDISNQKGVDFSALEYLVLDEADRMLDMGFIHDIKRLMKLMPKSKQTLLFSATFSSEIKTLASSLLTNPVTIEVARENSTAQQISQVVHLVDKGRKKELLSHLIKTHDWQQILVFMRTKHGANRLSKQLIESGITATAIHGNKSQGARTKALADFKARDVKVLVATDIAARGLDISDLPHVVNFELPNIPEDYVHRIGRTGRAGQSGEAVSLVSIDEHGLLKDIERFIKKNVPKVEIESFRPDPSIKAEPAKKKQNSRNNSSDRKRGTSRKKSKESLASEIGSNMMNKLDKYDKPKNTRSRRR